MKITWKKKKKVKHAVVATSPSLPFEQHQHDNNDVVSDDIQEKADSSLDSDSHIRRLADDFLAQGNQFALDGNFREALGKWETAIGLTPERSVLHEQKAQALLEVGDAWNALKSATRATELDPSWAEAWITLGRAQLNFGEPDTAIQSFDKALDIVPDAKDARDDRQAAMQLVKKRKQLHSTGLSHTENRYLVGDNAESSKFESIESDTMTPTKRKVYL